MKRPLIALLYGGGGHEHDISKESAQFLKSQVDSQKYKCHAHEITSSQGLAKLIKPYDYVIPCFHGYPGETGDIQSLLELENIPYFGSSSSAQKRCFHKLTTKLWANELQVAVTPYLFLPQNYSEESKKSCIQFFKQHQKIFVKATQQGSSIGCYPVQNLEDLFPIIEKAFQYSDSLLLEKEIQGREIEIAAFEYQGQLHLTGPGEIIKNANAWYSYEEKYQNSAETKTDINILLNHQVIAEITAQCKKLFSALSMKDLARFDFFVDEKDKVFLNEVNLMPGMASISLFPKLVEAKGISIKAFLADRIKTTLLSSS